MTTSQLRRFRSAGWVFVAVGVALLAMMTLGVSTPARAWLAFVFFAAAPGTALVPLVGVSDGAVAGILAVALSLVATVVVAQTMVWVHVFSPVAAVAILLAGSVVALCVPVRTASSSPDADDEAQEVAV